MNIHFFYIKMTSAQELARLIANAVDLKDPGGAYKAVTLSSMENVCALNVIAWIAGIVCKNRNDAINKMKAVKEVLNKNPSLMGEKLQGLDTDGICYVSRIVFDGLNAVLIFLVGESVEIVDFRKDFNQDVTHVMVFKNTGMHWIGGVTTNVDQCIKTTTAANLWKFEGILSQENVTICKCGHPIQINAICGNCERIAHEDEQKQSACSLAKPPGGNQPQWECAGCTFLNSPLLHKCEVCEADNKHQWACTGCTFLNSPLLHECEMCGKGR